MALKLPKLLALPPKLLPLITEFAKYKYFLIDGGRGSGKTQSVARLILYICEIHQDLRVVCGREQATNLEESVYTVLCDLIKENSLNFSITGGISNPKITHNRSGSVIRFRGFNDTGVVNVKGLEGVHILWIDECQAITKGILDELYPTLRKDDSRFIFTMNRYVHDDPIFEFAYPREDCLHIHIDYFENPYCPRTLIEEAQACKVRNEREYNHIWLGQPLSSADDALINGEKLRRALEMKPDGDYELKQVVMGIDFAAEGGDMCVVTILERSSNIHWTVKDQIAWNYTDPMESVGRIVNYVGRYKPDVAALDVGGMGHVVLSRLHEVGLQVLAFDGGKKDGVDQRTYQNLRAYGYFLLCEWLDMEFLHIPKENKQLIWELEKIKKITNSMGQKGIQKKSDMKSKTKGVGISPDHADSLMMAVWCAVTHLGKNPLQLSGSSHNITRVSKPKRFRKTREIVSRWGF